MSTHHLQSTFYKKLYKLLSRDLLGVGHEYHLPNHGCLVLTLELNNLKLNGQRTPGKKNQMPISGDWHKALHTGTTMVRATAGSRDIPS